MDTTAQEKDARRDGWAASPRGGFASLRNRDFRILWVATFVSNIGSWMQKVTTAWIIYELTASTAWLGFDALASGMTTVALLPIGGIVADRLDRRRLLVWTNLLLAFVAVSLAAFAGLHVLTAWHIVTLSALSGIAQAFMIPASTALLPSLVGDDDLPNAVALNSLQFNVSRAIGPILGGYVLIRAGAAWTFSLNALSFLALVAAFACIKKLPVPGTPQTTIARSLGDGMRYVRQRRMILIPLALVGLTATFGAPAISLLPALTADVLKRAAASYSVLLTCFGVGAIIAAIAVTLLGSRFERRGAIAGTIGVVGFSQIALAFGTWDFAGLLMALNGFGFVGLMVVLGTNILKDTDDEYRGRVTSLQQMCFRIGQPVGALVGGILADHIGIGSVFWLFGSLLVITAIVSSAGLIRMTNS